MPPTKPNRKQPRPDLRGTEDVIHARRLAQRFAVLVAALSVSVGALAVWGVSRRRAPPAPPAVVIETPAQATEAAPAAPPSAVAPPTAPAVVANSQAAVASPAPAATAAAVPTAAPATPTERLPLTAASVQLPNGAPAAAAPAPPTLVAPAASAGAAGRANADHETPAEVAADLASIELDIARAEQSGDKALSTRLEQERKDVQVRLRDAVQANGAAGAPGTAP